MTPFSGILLSMCLVLFGLVACEDRGKENRLADTVTVKIPVLENGKYRLDLVDLQTLDEIVQLRGGAARFFFSPTVREGKLIGLEPRIRTLKTKEGVYVPQDALSLQLLSIYANFEKLMLFDEKLGLKHLNSWPRAVAVNTRILGSNGAYSQDNARFSGQLDAFLFEPYTRTDLPLTVNAGVIGHEHFHSLFYQLVLKPLGALFSRDSVADLHQVSERIRALGGRTQARERVFTEREVYHITLLRAMNEGLADAWGWIYSGDSAFVTRSLGIQDRDLGLFSEAIPTSQRFFDRVRPFGDPDETLGDAYDIGSRYAKTLHRVVAVEMLRTQGRYEERVLRESMARAIIRSLPRLAREIQRLKNDELLYPSRVIEILSEEIPFMTTESCAVLRSKVPEGAQDRICGRRSREARAERRELP